MITKDEKQFFFFFQAEDGIRYRNVTGVQTCALPISACACTSAGDHRSKANVIDLRSCSRNSGLTCAAKLTVSSGPGRVTGASCSVATATGAGGPAGPQSQAGAPAPLA